MNNKILPLDRKQGGVHGLAGADERVKIIASLHAAHEIDA